jgi:hypothetical protein
LGKSLTSIFSLDPKLNRHSQRNCYNEHAQSAYGNHILGAPTGKRFLEWKNAALKNNAPVKVPAADSLNDVRIVNDCEKTRK